MSITLQALSSNLRLLPSQSWLRFKQKNVSFKRLPQVFLLRCNKDDGGISWVFSSCGASVGCLMKYHGDLREPLVWRQENPVFHSSCELELGIALQSLQGKIDLIYACVQDLVVLSREDRDPGVALQSPPWCCFPLLSSLYTPNMWGVTGRYQIVLNPRVPLLIPVCCYPECYSPTFHLENS